MSGTIRIKTYYGLQVLATKDLETAMILTSIFKKVLL